MRRPGPTAGGDALSIVVPQTSFLGDVVLTTPLLAALRERLRPRRLTVVVRPDAVALVAGHPAVDAVMVDDKRGRHRGLSGIGRMALRLRREGFDLAVSPHRSMRTALILAAARIPHRIGFADARGAWLYHDRVARDRRQHDVERNLALMAPFGGTSGIAPLALPLSAAAVETARRLAPPEGGRFAVLAPASAWPTKQWTVEGYAGVARGLVAAGRRVIVVGAPAEEARCAAVAVAGGPGVESVAGRVDLATTIALIDRATVVVANDSAPMHVACARGVPVVAVFCATSPRQGYGPWSERARVVEIDLACRPCGRHGGRTCPRGTEDCARLITIGAVLDAVQDVQRPVEAA